MAYGAILGQTPTASNVTYNNSQTSSIITGTNVQQAIDQLFTSVSNGKAQIASAITDKGVSTSASDTFAQMAANIGAIESASFSEILTIESESVGSGWLKEYQFKVNAPSPGWNRIMFYYTNTQDAGFSLLNSSGEVLLGDSKFSVSISDDFIILKSAQSLIGSIPPTGYFAFCI